MHYWYLAPFYAFVLTVLFSFPLRSLAEKWGMVAVPGGRRDHGEPVPMTGGIAMFIGTAWGFEATHGVNADWSMFLLACALMAVVGLLDDVFDLRASIRTVGHLVGALMMTVGAGHVIRLLGEPFFMGPVGTGFLAIPFTVLVTMTVINAYNMMDGIDGLAAGTSLITLGAMAVLATTFGLYPESIYLYVLIASVLGFMVFNLPLGVNARLRTFMGDAGSMFLGLAITWFGVVLTQGEAAVASAVSVLWFAALPIHDLIATVVHRLMEGRLPWLAGSDHVHHHLMARGISSRWTLALLLATSVAYAVIGLSGPLLGVKDGVLFIAWILAGVGHFLVFRRRGLIRAALRRLITGK
jgi:UDP-GlcNAc:undecaprenyl-phosphate GlcNAc-1-phosphate transferase